VDRRRITVAIVAAALVGLGGCGGSSSSSSSSFKKDYPAQENQFKQASQAIGNAIQGASSQNDAQLGTTFKSLATRWQGIVSNVKALKPPKSVATEFNTVVDAGTRAGTDLTQIASAATTHNSSAASKAAGSVVTDITAARNASQAIDKKLGIK
jgi:hypothetical protein